MQGNRAFIAIDIPSEIRQKITEATRGLNGREVRQVPEEQMHVTLFFFEQIEDDQISKVIEVLTCAKIEPFNMTMKGAGVFTPSRPRVIFVDIKEVKELKRMHSILKQELRAAGLPLEDREFAPHLTVGRIKKSDREIEEKLLLFLEQNEAKEFGSFECREIKLIKSALNGESPIHETVFVRKF